MPFVLDASVTMSWCFTDERTIYGQRVLDILRTSYAHVPALWIAEVNNVLLINERKGRITGQGTKEFLETLMRLDIRIDLEEPTFDESLL